MKRYEIGRDGKRIHSSMTRRELIETALEIKAENEQLKKEIDKLSEGLETCRVCQQLRLI